MQAMPQDNDEVDLKPIPIDNEMKTEEESQLIPLPIDESATTDPQITADNDTEMKDSTIQEIEIIEEEEEEAGVIMEEEEEESGDVIAPPQPPNNTNNHNNSNSTTTNHNNTNTITAPKKPINDKDRARSHPITTNTQAGPRYLNIHLMPEWNNGEVLQWLTHRFGLWGQQYVPVFSNKKIDGARLSQLTENDLKTDFKVTKALHLVRMCRDITDSKRSLQQINQLITPCYIDGANAASKLMRFGPREVYAFSTRIPLLKMHSQTFLDRKINGRVLLECNDVQLVTAMKNESITLVDAHTILEYIEQIKKEDSIVDKNAMSESAYLPIQAVYDVWTEMCKINEVRFKLLPQHIRDYSKPAPTYFPPPQAQSRYGYGQGSGAHLAGGARLGSGAHLARDGNDNDEPGTPPLYQVKAVTEWNTEDCINWLGQIKESKVDLRVRYTPHFEQIKMTGPILLNMTPSTLSSICCITTKTHLKQLVKAIDKIRDHLVFNGFGQLAHVKEFTQKYGGGYSLPAQRYHTSYNEQYERNKMYQQAQQPPVQAKQAQQPQPVEQKSETSNTAQNDASAAKCFVCGKTGNVMRCSQCKAAFYCSREHQVSDWARHSKECQK